MLLFTVLRLVLGLKRDCSDETPNSRQDLRQQQGFTLFELLVVLIIFGILTALIAPGISGLRNRFQVQAAFDQIRQVLREAQVEAIRSGQACTVTLNLAQPPINISAHLNQAAATPSQNPTQFNSTQPTTQPACAINRTLPDEIRIANNFNVNTAEITFSYQGGIVLTNKNSFTAVIYWDNNPELEKPCFVLSSGIGIMRTGHYIKEIPPPPDPKDPLDPSKAVNPDACQANPNGT